jgi:hypothetical protein
LLPRVGHTQGLLQSLAYISIYSGVSAAE